MYAVAVTVHLLCATVFIGVVFFEVLLLEGVRRYVGETIIEQVERGLIRRARWVMPPVVLVLFATGIYLASQHFTAGAFTWSNSFLVLLSIKIVLAFSVLVHFVTAMTGAHLGWMTPVRFRFVHLSVGLHMLLIVVLAKAMFYVSW